MQNWKTKHKTAGFDDAKVHVYCRRHRKSDGKYKIDAIVDDFEWLARYVIAKKIQAYITDDMRQDMVQHLMMFAVRYAKKYPYENTMGSPQPAFAYFTVVMYHAGLGFIKEFRKKRGVHEQLPDDKSFEKPVETDLPPAFITEKMEQLIINARKNWFDNPVLNKKLRKLLEKTASQGYSIRLNRSTQLNRVYQCILMLTIDSESFPEANSVDVDLYTKLLSLLVGERKAKQALWLNQVVNGEVEYSPG